MRAGAVVFLILGSCAGNEDAERWRYERVLWEEKPQIQSHEEIPVRFAQLSADRELTLEECYEMALHRSETLAITGEELVRLETQFDQAVGAILPRISFKGTYTRQEEVNTGGFSTFTLPERTESKVAATQPIFGGLREYYGIGQVSSLREAKEHDLRHARLLLFEDVAEAFYAVLQSERDVATTQDTLALAKERLEELVQRNRVGISRRSEVLAQEAEVASTQASLEELKGVREVAWETLRFVIGFRGRPTLLDVGTPPSEWPTAETLVQQALSRRSDLQSLERQIEASQEALRIAQSGYLPTVTLDANYYTHREGLSEEIDWDLLLTLEMPLFDGLTTYAKIREAESSQRTAQLQRLNLVRQVGLEIHRAYADVLSLRSELASLEKAAASAQENHEIVQAEYRQNIVTNLEVLQAFNTLQRARLERDRTETELKLAAIRLRVQCGERR